MTDPAMNPTDSNDSTNGAGEQDEEIKDPKALLAKTRELLGKVSAQGKEKAELMRKLKAFEDAKAAQEQKELEARGEFEKIKQTYEAKIAEMDGKLSEIAARDTYNKKFVAFMRNLSGKLEDRYFPLVDIEGIAVNPDTGEVDQATVLSTVKKFEASYGNLLTKPGKRMDSEAPGSGGQTPGKISHAEYLRLLSSKDPAEVKKGTAYKRDQIIF